MEFTRDRQLRVRGAGKLGFNKEILFPWGRSARYRRGRRDQLLLANAQRKHLILTQLAKKTLIKFHDSQDRHRQVRTKIFDTFSTLFNTPRASSPSQFPAMAVTQQVPTLVILATHAKHALGRVVQAARLLQFAKIIKL